MMPDNTDVFHVSGWDLKELYNKKNLCVSHAENCRDENCEWCQQLCDEGYIISCDCCGRIHHTTWKLWTGVVNENGQCAVFCPGCKDEAA